MKKHKEVLWTLLAFALAIVSIAVVLGQSKEISFSNLWQLVTQSNPFWIILACVCMFGYIFLEGYALQILLGSTGYYKTLGQTLTYASADIYCAAITPSSTGGQPVCAWFMKRDGIPMGYITGVLAIYLIAHTFATVGVGIGTAVLFPDTFLSYSTFGKILIVLGYFTIFFLAVLFIALLRMQKQISRTGNRIIGWLVKKGLVKREQYWRDRLESGISDYSECVKLMRGKMKIFWAVFGINVLQRLSQTVISTLVYLASGNPTENAGTVFATQVFTTIGSFCVPIPGGMGAADYLLYDGLSTIMDHESAIQLELLARGFTFYLLVIVSLLIVVVGYFIRKRIYFTVKKNN